jgi:Winged helix DNA-binding domain
VFPPRASKALLVQRLRNQRLCGSTLNTPAAVVEWLGAVQAQDYAGACWAVGQRAPLLTAGAVHQAVDEGSILRTHVLRPTWHFVAPADIRWMLALTAPRVKALCAFYHRQAGLDARTFAKSQVVIVRALEGGRSMTRAEIAAVLARAGITATGTALGHITAQAELDAVVCSGPRRGKQQTYALLDERAPHPPVLTREEALARLTRRYFQSHGPALLADFVWWSGLTVKDARAGIATAAPALLRLPLDGLEYWHTGDLPPLSRQTPAACLLPNYDEYVVAYRERGLMIDQGSDVVPTPAEILANVMVIGGRAAGTWKRTLASNHASIEIRPFRALTPAEQRLLARAAERYGRFLGIPATLTPDS